MDWLPTQADNVAIFAWCMLTSDIGRPLMTLVGFGGLIATIRSLWTLPAVADTDIVTNRNKERRYRRRTVIVGVLALILFSISILLYFYSNSLLRAMGKVCEMGQASHTAAMAVLPFLLTTVLALAFFAWLQASTLKLKNR
jgi:hypothetical protein